MFNKTSILFSTLVLLATYPAISQTGAGAGTTNASPTTVTPTSPANQANPTSGNPATNSATMPGSSDPTSGALKTPPTNSQTGRLPTVRPTANPLNNSATNPNNAPRVQEPSARPCPPTNSAGGADRPRIAGNLPTESTNCIPSPGTPSESSGTMTR